MINEKKWLNTITIDKVHELNKNHVNHEKWVNTISQKNPYKSVRKYSTLCALFVFGLLLVSAVKNETRNLQKEIFNLKVSIKAINFNLNQAILDNEVITSPENLSKLAKEHLNTDFNAYKRSQIKHFDDKTIEQEENSYIKKTKVKKIKENLKIQVSKKIKKGKKNAEKIQNLYENPKTIPKEIKTKISKEIQEKKNTFKSIYDSPKEMLTLERVQRWGAVQVVKVFLGMPIIPGR